MLNKNLHFFVATRAQSPSILILKRRITRFIIDGASRQNASQGVQDFQIFPGVTPRTPGSGPVPLDLPNTTAVISFYALIPE